MSTSEYLWGIDLGGTKIEGVILESKENPAVIERMRIPTEGDQGYDHVLNRIKGLIDSMSEKAGITPTSLGIGTPGSIDPHTGLLKNSNSIHLNHQPFLRDLQGRLQIPVKIANDANCFALAEAKMGIVQDINPSAEVVFGVIMGTGVGGGLVINGKVINGHQGIAGEWGHNYLDDSGGDCYCGKKGCAERILSGPALQRYYQTISGKIETLKIITESANSGDPNSMQTIDRLIHFFGLGISTIINTIDPEVIVLGGGVGNIEALYSRGIEEAKKHTFNTRFDTQIVKPKLGDSAGVFGAAFLS